jgi:hypothetical protein
MAHTTLHAAHVCRAAARPGRMAQLFLEPPHLVHTLVLCASPVCPNGLKLPERPGGGGPGAPGHGARPPYARCGKCCAAAYCSRGCQQARAWVRRVYGCVGVWVCPHGCVVCWV